MGSGIPNGVRRRSAATRTYMHTTTDTVTGVDTTTDIDAQTHLRVCEFGDVHVGGLRHFHFQNSPRNLTQVTSTMKPGQDSMFGFSSVKRITLREGLY